MIQWGPWIVQKSIVWLINSSKNKLNSEIIFIYNPNPNARVASVWKLRFAYFPAEAFFLWVPCTVHETHKYLHLVTFKKKKKISLTVLFTHLKIILLQYFQFLVFNNKQYPNRSLIVLSLKIFCGRKELQLFLSHWYARYL